MADQAIAETLVTQRITDSGAQVAIVVLDACRNNPFQAPDRRALGGTRGLASKNEPPSGVFSIYSAGFGQEALDRLGPTDRHPNSVFTRVFIEKLKTRGLDLHAVVRQTRAIVSEQAEKIGHKQVPAYYEQIVGGDIYLAGPPTAKPGVAQSPPPAAVDPDAATRRDYELAAQVGTREAWDAFLARHPSGYYADLARIARGKLAVVAPGQHVAPSLAGTPKQPAGGLLSIDPSPQPLPIAGLGVTIGDTIARVKKVFSIDREPEPYQSIKPKLLLREKTKGIWFFFVDGKLETIRLDEPFSGRIGGIGLRDTLAKLTQTLGKPNKQFNSSDKEAYIYSLGNVRVRYDVDKSSEVATILLFE